MLKAIGKDLNGKILTNGKKFVKCVNIFRQNFAPYGSSKNILTTCTGSREHIWLYYNRQLQPLVFLLYTCFSSIWIVRIHTCNSYAVSIHKITIPYLRIIDY